MNRNNSPLNDDEAYLPPNLTASISYHVGKHSFFAQINFADISSRIAFEDFIRGKTAITIRRTKDGTVELLTDLNP